MPFPCNTQTCWQAEVCEATALDLLCRYDVEGYTTVAGTPALNSESSLYLLLQSL